MSLEKHEHGVRTLFSLLLSITESVAIELNTKWENADDGKLIKWNEVLYTSNTAYTFQSTDKLCFIWLQKFYNVFFCKCITTVFDKMGWHIFVLKIVRDIRNGCFGSEFTKMEIKKKTIEWERFQFSSRNVLQFEFML